MFCYFVFVFSFLEGSNIVITIRNTGGVFDDGDNNDENKYNSYCDDEDEDGGTTASKFDGICQIGGNTKRTSSSIIDDRRRRRVAGFVLFCAGTDNRSYVPVIDAS